MLGYHADFCYVPVAGAELFTAILLPRAEGKFPCVVVRNPYVDALEKDTEREICASNLIRYVLLITDKQSA